MLHQDTVNQYNALETHLCVPFNKLERFPMKRDEMELFIKLELTIDQSAVDDMFNSIKQKSWVLEAMQRRMEVSLTIGIDLKVLIMLLYLADGRIGRAIMYLYYLQYWAKLHNVKKIDWKTFGMRIFPMGFPSESGLSKVWDGQKVSKQENKFDNLIDYPIAATSIMF